MRTPSCKVSVLDDVGNPDAPVGSQPWAKWMVGQARLSRHDLQRDVQMLQLVIDKLERFEAWKALGFASFSLLCHAELQLDGDEIAAIKQAKPGRTLAQVLAADPEIEPLADGPGNPTGANQHTERNSADGTIPTRGSNKAETIVRRLKRDAPSIAERLAAGEFKSARAAGIAAGIVKVPTALDVLRRAWKKASEGEREEFLKFIA